MIFVCTALILLPFPLIAAAFSWRCITKYSSYWKFFLFLFVYTIFVFSYIMTLSSENVLSSYFLIVVSLRAVWRGAVAEEM